MGGLHKKIKKVGRNVTLWGAVDKETFDEFHPMGTQAEGAYDLKKEQEKALKDLEANPSKDVIPMADEEELERARRRRGARMRGAGRASTALAQEEGFGG
jgi:hypothetical protein